MTLYKTLNYFEEALGAGVGATESRRRSAYSGAAEGFFGFL